MAAISHKSDELSQHNSLRLPLIMNVNATTLKERERRSGIETITQYNNFL